MNTLIERLKQKVLTLSPAEPDEPESELSDFGMVQLELMQIRSDIAALQKSVDDLAKVLTVQPAQPTKESVNTSAENEMLAHVANEPVNTLKTPRKRSTTARRSTR